MNFIPNESYYDKEKEPYKYISYLYEELQKTINDINIYNEEIENINKNNFTSHFNNFLEIDPIHEILTSTMTLDQYVEKLLALKEKADPNKDIIIKPYSDLNNTLQRSEILIPLRTPTKEDLKDRVQELNNLVKSLEIKKGDIKKEILQQQQLIK